MQSKHDHKSDPFDYISGNSFFHLRTERKSPKVSKAMMTALKNNQRTTSQRFRSPAYRTFCKPLADHRFVPSPYMLHLDAKKKPLHSNAWINQNLASRNIQKTLSRKLEGGAKTTHNSPVRLNKPVATHATSCDQIILGI